MNRRVKAFMRDRCYDESLLFSSFKAGCTRLSLRGLQRVKWLPAEHFEFFYGSENARVIAEREHCARLLRVNPSFPIDQVLPFHRVALSVAEEKEEIVVTQKEAGQLILPLLQKRLREQQVGKEEIDEICSDARARLTSFIVEHPLVLMNSTRSLLFVVEHATPQDLLLTWGCLVAWQQRSISLMEIVSSASRYRVSKATAFRLASSAKKGPCTLANRSRRASRAFS